MKRFCATYLILLLLPFILGWQTVHAQQNPIPPNTLREADVMISKRIWRVIDLREKQNYPAIWPGNPINKILYKSVLDGNLFPYYSDSLRKKIHSKAFSLIGGDTQFVQVILDPNDPDNYRIDTVIDVMDPEQRIKHLMLMEELIFDKKLGTSYHRIIAIAPLYTIRFAGEAVGLAPLCWLRYHDRLDKEKDCRDVLVNQVVFNKENSLSRFSFDDWFEQRRFNSFIVKESNQYDLSIMDDPEVKRNGLHALIEAARIKQEQFERGDQMYED